MEKTPVEKRLNTIKRNKIKRKTKKIIFAIGLTLSVFVVATYAWFMGVTTVKINPFEIDISTSDGLSISLDAVRWDTSIDISEAAITTDLDSKTPNPYTRSQGRINHWISTDGLVPISTTAALNTSTSRLSFYSKQSITSSIGGFKLRTSLIENDDTDATTGEDRNYIMFDLFIRNGSASTYNETYNNNEDEAVFLSNDASVTYVAEDGVGGEGIQNSMRIGLYSLGRIHSKSENVNAIQTMNCSTTTNGITSLCNKPRGETWNVWEPNDTNHTAAAITRFNHICVKRGSDGTYSTAEGDASKCNAIGASDVVTTHAINGTIDISTTPEVNVYDGLNGYTRSDGLLRTVQYYGDSIRQNDDTKPEFMFLAPNSITKVRVYVWLEGQDIDNYDISSEYGKIKVNLILTKDRYESLE